MPLTECSPNIRTQGSVELYKNIVYVGALAALLDIDLAVMEKLTVERFKGKDSSSRPMSVRCASAMMKAGEV